MAGRAGRPTVPDMTPTSAAIEAPSVAPRRSAAASWFCLVAAVLTVAGSLAIAFVPTTVAHDLSEGRLNLASRWPRGRPTVTLGAERSEREVWP